MDKWGVIGSILGVAALIVVMILASRVGGIGIRGINRPGEMLDVLVSEPLLRGVPIVVRWEPGEQAQGMVLVEVRTAEGEQLIGQGSFAEGRASVVVPCDLAADRVALTLLADDTGAVLAQRTVDLLPAGEECALGS